MPDGLPIIKFTDNGEPLSQAASLTVLSQFLKGQRAKKIKVWDAGSIYYGFVTTKSGAKRKVEIFFPNKVVYRAKHIADTKIKRARYDIVGKKIGQGAYGSVHDVFATLSHLKSGSMRIAKHDYVIKIQDHTIKDENGKLKNEPKWAKNEARMGRFAHYLGMKYVTFRKNKKGNVIESYLVSHKLKKNTLVDIIIKDWQQKAIINTQDRIIYSIQLIRAYLYQLYDRGIVHKDIQTRNVMVDSDGVIKYFDLAFSRTINEKEDDNFSGTPMFVAPEVLTTTPPQDEKSDFYSLGIMLFQLWRATQYQDTEDDLRAAAEAGDERFFDAFGVGIKDIDSFKKDLIRALYGLIAYEKEKRIHPLKVLEVFEDARLQYKIDYSLGEKLRDSISLTAANKIARKTNNALHDIVITKKSNPLIELQNTLNQAITELQDHPIDKTLSKREIKEAREAMVEEFLEVLDIRIFRELNNGQRLSLEEIKLKAQQIIIDFQNNMQMALKLADRIDLSLKLIELKSIKYDTSDLHFELAPMLEDVHVILYKLKNCDVTFDDLHELNQKMANKILALQSSLLDFELRCNAHQRELAPMLSYLNILRQLEPRVQGHQENDNIFQLKNLLTTIIDNYFRQTFTLENIKAGKEAASQKMQHHVEHIFEIIKFEKDETTLRSRINKELDAMGFSLFSNPLKRNLRQVVNSPTNQPPRLVV